MSRDTRHPGGGQMGNNSRQNQMIRDVARAKGISAEDLADAVHRLKDDWDGGDFSYSDLCDIADDVKRNGGY